MHLSPWFALSLLLALGGRARAQAILWTVHPTTGEWYGLTPSLPFVEAEALAQAQGGHLVTLSSAAEDAWVQSQVSSLVPYFAWIGLEDLTGSGTYAWTSGEPVAYTNWAPGEPNNPNHFPVAACYSYLHGWLWDDRAATSSFPAIVERGPRPPAGWSFPTSHATQSFPLDFDVGDLDGNGFPDAVVANFRTNSVSVFLGQPDGTLAPALNFALPGGFLAFTAVVGDFTGDAALDVAAASGTHIYVLRGNGTGALALSYQLDAPGYVVDMVRADFNGDGHLDLAATTYLSAERVCVFLSDGHGGFAPAVTYPTPAEPYNLACADVDLDGDVDLVVTGYQAGSFVVYLNQGTGALSALPAVPFGSYVGRPAIADWNRDGIPDLAIPANGFNKIAWGHGDGTFDMTGPVLAGGIAEGFAEAADIDGDGFPDLAVTQSGSPVVFVFLSRPGGQLVPAAQLLTGEWPVCVRAANLVGDARPELLVTSRNSDRLIVYRNLTPDCNVNGADDTSDIAADPSLDLDHDGLLDACESVGSPFCFGDGSGTACPCGPAQLGDSGAGCRNSSGTSGRLAASGHASVAFDSVTLRASDLPSATVGLVFQGNAAQNGGAGTPFGDGLRCAGQSVVRLVIRAASQGEIGFGHAVPGDPGVALAGNVPSSGATRYYQTWYRDAGAYCTTSTFNLTNGVALTWQP